ncbi:unnamed protein product [Angiostrongylus costaricensis]|uniref:Uncharacterized protein n=1 Tax=Angiostrongylus costaricensis TaxID=334426 RepID=A0A0R3PE93_ANGCS|nr:unnamed protein product [Angiostrongylus costaricensis]
MPHSLLNGTNISECSSYVYLGREINMVNDLALELSRRKQVPWGALKSVEDVVKKTKNTRIRAYFFDSTAHPALTYASETRSLRQQNERSLSVIERAVERTMLGVSCSTQLRIRSSDLRQRSKIKDAVLYARQSKIRWAGHVMRVNDNRWTRVTGFLGMSNVLQEDHRPDERAEPTGLLLHVIGKVEDLLVHARVTRRPTGLQSALTVLCEFVMVSERLLLTSVLDLQKAKFDLFIKKPSFD